jgi:hypothetical protein
MWCHELKRTGSATSPGSRAVNPGFLRVVATPHLGPSEDWYKQYPAFFADMLDDGMGQGR